LIEQARKEYERRFAEIDAAVAEREEVVHLQLAELAKERESIQSQVTAKVDAERNRIAGEEGEKVRRLFETDIRQREQQLAELSEVLRKRKPIPARIWRSRESRW